MSDDVHRVVEGLDFDDLVQAFLAEADEEQHVTLNFELDDTHVRQIEIPFTVPLLWGAYRAIHRGGYHESEALVLFGWLIYSKLKDAGVASPFDEFRNVWRQLGDTFDLDINRWDDEDDLMLSFLYFLLDQEHINRHEAAAMVHVLNNPDIDPRQVPVYEADDPEVDRWRKRVNRWADKHDLPHPVKRRQPRRRSADRTA